MKVLLSIVIPTLTRHYPIVKPSYYDLVIMDYLLPNFNGVQLYNKLKSIDNSVRAVMLTATQERIDTSELKHLQVLRKPILRSTFIEQIRKILKE